jgi:periplasmic divalent cation tolerance protein
LELRVVLCTAPVDEAVAIARGLVEQQLCACVNVVPGLTSVYRWAGEVCADPESLLVIKTRAEHLDALTEAIKQRHPYSVPEVIALPLAEGGNPDYLQWLVAETER